MSRNPKVLWSQRSDKALPEARDVSVQAGLGIRVAIKPEYRITPPGSGADPVVSKYISSGLSREAVPLAVQHYGDDSTKVLSRDLQAFLYMDLKVWEFLKSQTLLRVMGFSSSNISEALLMYDNDTDKALAHLLDNSS